MPKVLSVREESSEEKKIREWFETQTIESPKNLEEAARLLISLVTGLLGFIFGVFTFSNLNMSSFLALPLIKVCGVIALTLWLLSLVSGLFVVLPRPWFTNANYPSSELVIFKKVLRYKSNWLTISAVSFGIAIIALGTILIAFLLQK